MAITTQLVGKLGGGKVEKIEINFTSPDSPGTYDIVTVPIPAGVPHMVVLKIKTTASSSGSGAYMPRIFFGTVDKGTYYNSPYPFTAGDIHDSALTVKAQRNGSSASYSASFTGTIYYAPTGN